MMTILTFLSLGALILVIAIAQTFIQKKLWDKDQTHSFTVEGTTTLVNPIAAATCSHSWETKTDDLLETDQEKKRILVMHCPLCGSIDKTIESVEKKCKHSWSKVKDRVIDCAYNDLDDYTMMSLNSIPKWMFKKTAIIVQKCTKCGEIHETIVETEKGK
jgi:hypothetical protein